MTDFIVAYADTHVKGYAKITADALPRGWAALLGTTSALEAPTRCGERLDLLETARSALPDEQAFRSLAAALLPCAEVPAAQTLLLGLLEEAPVKRVVGIVRGWTTRVNESLEGGLPEPTAKLLKRRLEKEPESTGLFEALDLVYEVSGGWDLRGVRCLGSAIRASAALA